LLALNPLITATLALGGVLWIVALVVALRGRDMSMGQRILILGLLLVATPLGAYLILR
jgi:hypothetical protein